MTTSLGLKHYGRGPLKILIPRVYSRKRRKEWIINPSLLIFLISVTTIFIVNHTLLNKKHYQYKRTTILLPHIEKAPEPVAARRISLIKVLKTAAKKTIETPKVVEEKMEEPKPLDQPVPEKKIDALKPLDNKIEPKVIESAAPLPKVIAEKQIIPKAMVAKPLVARDIPTHTLPPQNRISPSAIPKVSTLPTAAPAPAARALATRSSFNAMTPIERSVAAKTSGESMAVPPPSHTAPSRGPRPELAQIDSAKLPPSRGGAIGGGSSALTSAGALKPSTRQISRNTETPLPRFSAPAGSDGAEEIVIIKSKALGSSERVKILKQDIMKKARKMNPDNSPYTYKVKGYTCTLIIEEAGGTKKVIIDFSPADAPFEVVSALERTLR
jgi:hypothetical protein